MLYGENPAEGEPDIPYEAMEIEIPLNAAAQGCKGRWSESVLTALTSVLSLGTVANFMVCLNLAFDDANDVSQHTCNRVVAVCAMVFLSLAILSMCRQAINRKQVQTSAFGEMGVICALTLQFMKDVEGSCPEPGYRVTVAVGLLVCLILSRFRMISEATTFTMYDSCSYLCMAGTFICCSSLVAIRGSDDMEDENVTGYTCTSASFSLICLAFAMSLTLAYHTRSRIIMAHSLASACCVVGFLVAPNLHFIPVCNNTLFIVLMILAGECVCGALSIHFQT